MSLTLPLLYFSWGRCNYIGVNHLNYVMHFNNEVPYRYGQIWVFIIRRELYHKEFRHLKMTLCTQYSVQRLPPFCKDRFCVTVLWWLHHTKRNLKDWPLPVWRGLCKYFVPSLLNRPPTSVTGATGSELGRITFIFETICSADCVLYFMAVSETSFSMAEDWAWYCTCHFSTSA